MGTKLSKGSKLVEMNTKACPKLQISTNAHLKRTSDATNPTSSLTPSILSSQGSQGSERPPSACGRNSKSTVLLQRGALMIRGARPCGMRGITEAESTSWRNAKAGSTQDGCDFYKGIRANTTRIAWCEYLFISFTRRTFTVWS